MAVIRLQLEELFCRNEIYCFNHSLGSVVVCACVCMLNINSVSRGAENTPFRNNLLFEGL